jgi:hypothetical protein
MSPASRSLCAARSALGHSHPSEALACVGRERIAVATEPLPVGPKPPKASEATSSKSSKARATGLTFLARVNHRNPVEGVGSHPLRGVRHGSHPALWVVRGSPFGPAAHPRVPHGQTSGLSSGSGDSCHGRASRAQNGNGLGVKRCGSVLSTETNAVTQDSQRGCWRCLGLRSFRMRRPGWRR